MENIYYVYAYIRSKNSATAKAGTPYYIGKGKGTRKTASHGKILVPSNNFIIILESNLTEIGAFALERRYIKWYGRKNNQTGILLNKTDGGEGNSGTIRTSSWNKGKKMGPLSNEHKQKVSKALKGRVLSDKHKSSLSKRNQGIQNNLGKMWINNKVICKMISVNSLIPVGWSKGRFITIIPE